MWDDDCNMARIHAPLNGWAVFEPRLMLRCPKDGRPLWMHIVGRKREGGVWIYYTYCHEVCMQLG